MRKTLLILAAIPTFAFANPMHSGTGCGGMLIPPMHQHHLKNGENGPAVPKFLEDLNLTEPQITAVKALFMAQKSNMESDMSALKTLNLAIKKLSFSEAYSDAKVQALLDAAPKTHRTFTLQKSKLDNAIFKLLTQQQQQKLLDKLAQCES